METVHGDSIRYYEERFSAVYAQKRLEVDKLVSAIHDDDMAAQNTAVPVTRLI